MTVKNSIYALVLFFALASTAFAQSGVFVEDDKPPFHFEAKADSENSLYACGELAKVDVSLHAAGSENPIDGFKFSGEIAGDWGLKKQLQNLDSSRGGYIAEAALKKPGFVLIKLKFQPAADAKAYEGLAGIGFDPLKIKPATLEPTDFDEFWSKAKEELASVPLNSKMQPVEIAGAQAGKIECFDIKADCAGGAPVSGYMARPTGAKPHSLPAIVTYHGAGVRSALKPLEKASKGFLALDVNAHGIENGQPSSYYKTLRNGALKDYQLRDCDNPQKIYFRGMFLRVLRSLEFIKAQPEWDGRILIVSGMSQGGAQAIVAAALDPQVSLCVAHVPALCYLAEPLEARGGNGGWPYFIKTKDGAPESQALVDAVQYYDAATFARRIKCATLFSVGFIDTVCPPSTVFAAFNKIINVDNKRIVNNPEGGHTVTQKASEAEERTISEHLKLMNSARIQ